MKNIPTVAVITRTKDREILLERALKSVHGQTFTDFIHVIINDGGDRTAVDGLIQEHQDLVADRVQVIHNAESNGMEAASNRAIKNSQSLFIAIHDDDDTWHPEFLERTVGYLRETGTAGVVVRTDKITEEIIDDSGDVRRVKVEPWMPDLKVINLYRQCIDNQMTPITFIYKREILDEIGYYDESLPVLGDWEFGIRFLKKFDVDFIDPGFALANYHHRKYKPGAAGNTSYAGNEKHRYYKNKIMNKLLRQEVSRGELGVGYIMSQSWYSQSYLAKLTFNIMPNSIARFLKNRAGR